MATIKEMAENTFPETVNYYDNINNMNKRYGYIKGANAVMKVIESALLSSDNPLAMLGAADEVIKQLKGE